MNLEEIILYAGGTDALMEQATDAIISLGCTVNGANVDENREAIRVLSVFRDVMRALSDRTCNPADES